MGCRLSNFKIGPWKQHNVLGHRVDIADATTKGLGLHGVVCKLDGKFQGFIGSTDAAIDWMIAKCEVRGLTDAPAS